MAANSRRLSAPFLASLKPSDRVVEVFDSQMPGLAFRVYPSGRRSWVLFYRARGRLRRITLGHYPGLELAKARKEATRHRAQVHSGADPLEAKAAERATWVETFGQLWKVYAAERAPKERAWTEKRRAIEAEVLPHWEHRLVREITRADIRGLLQRKALTAPIMANRLLHYIGPVMTFALERDWITSHPCARMAKPAPERSRDRVLSRQELRALWIALTTDSTPAPTQGEPVFPPVMKALFVVLMLTAQRLGEVARMRWDDLDSHARVWTIPATLSKNGTPHRVPLSPLVGEVLDRLRLRPGRALDGAEPDGYVFSLHGRVHVYARSRKAASRLSRHLRLDNGSSFSFRAHDLRRTAASYMAEAGIPREHIAYVLNHRSVTHAQITAVYDRYERDAEKRTALETWARTLVNIIGVNTAASVLPFARSTTPAVPKV